MPRLPRLALCAAVALGPTGARAQSDVVGVLVLKEHGVGSPTLAQPYVEKFVGIAAVENGWPGAQGRYVVTRAAAEAFIAEAHPHYGIFSLAAFLALREKYELEVVGRVQSALVGGQQYFIVSKNADDLAGCKGRTLASDHLDDPRFVERVVAGGAFTLAEFTVVQNRRPLQSLMQVLTGEAECALIDDAQKAELAHLQGAEGSRVVWESRDLPAMTVVAFPSAPAAGRERFKQSLAGVCDGDGRTACEEVGIRALEAASPKEYAAIVAAYGR
jgi:hypothetical protein